MVYLQGTSLASNPQPRGEHPCEGDQLPCDAKVKTAEATRLAAEPPSASSDHTGNCPSGEGEARLATMLVEETEVTSLPWCRAGLSSLQPACDASQSDDSRNAA